MIPKGHRDNFATMLKAAKYGDLALLECTDAKTGLPVYVVCMMNRAEDGDYLPTPVAKLFDGNPYEEVIPPELVPYP
jgi:hypothetical protein